MNNEPILWSVGCKKAQRDGSVVISHYGSHSYFHSQDILNTASQKYMEMGWQIPQRDKCFVLKRGKV